LPPPTLRGLGLLLGHAVVENMRIEAVIRALKVFFPRTCRVFQTVPYNFIIAVVTVTARIAARAGHDPAIRREYVQRIIVRFTQAIDISYKSILMQSDNG
jgi:hypothetical protein